MSAAAFAPTDMPTIEPALFKEVMRKLAASVVVITTSEHGVPHGMTATAICSVSASPPSVLVVINRTARSHAILQRTGIFAVHILEETQTGLSDNFAAGTDLQFRGVDYHIGPGALPILEQAAAYVVCETEETFDYATHTIFVGRIVNASISTGVPLIHYDRAYRRLA